MNNSTESPAGSKPTSKMPFSFLELRSKILQFFSWGTAVVGLYVIVYLWGHLSLWVLAPMVAFYILFLITAFAPIQYPYKVSALLAILFLLGMNELFQTGIFGNARIFFLVLILLAGIFFGRREALIALGVSLVAVASIGWLLLSNRIGLVSQEVNAGHLSTWITETLLMILVAVAIEEGWQGLCKEYFITQMTLKNAMNTLSNERVNLETRVAERIKDTVANTETERIRADRLQALSELMREVSVIQEPGEMMRSLSHLIGEKYGLYHVGIFLNDDDGAYTVLRAANSAGGERLISRGYKLKIDQSGIVNFVAATGNPRIAKRVKDDILFENNPDLPETRSIMALPLKVNTRLIGVLDLESNQEASLSEQDLEVMNLVAGQAAVAIANSRLFSETQNALAEARLVYGHYMRQAWEQLVTEKKTLGYRYSGSRVDALAAPLDFPEIQSALESGQSVGSKTEQPTITIPLKLRDEVIGVLDIRSSNPNRQWNENELAIIQATSERVALALENARLFEETTRRADRERTVSEITTHIRSTTDPQAMLQTALDELKRALGAKDIRIHPYSPPPADQGNKQ